MSFDFLEHTGDGKFFQEAGISFGPSDRLARLAKTIMKKTLIEALEDRSNAGYST